MTHTVYPPSYVQQVENSVLEQEVMNSIRQQLEFENKHVQELMHIWKTNLKITLK